MTRIAVLRSTNVDLVAYVEKAPQRGETVTGREFRTIPGGKGANQAIAAARAGATVSMTTEGPLSTVVAGTEPARAHGVRTILLVPDEHEAAALPGLPDPREVTAVDSTGAGDIFVGALAAPSVQREGASTSMPYRSEIEAQFTQ
ncbi:PfkB family carbohydrate kinase [Streptomyces sp. TRM70350]|uniref:PfkB family carbohydrate kinase n=1 Tax=Streptomyces sp. TRM70350 TaxID=2856165 RepID=UPI001C456F2F|nr:PfkB family carbohydrate kinase [Streptomyces sp. TRM70350]MBV7694944.1 hypothetical protein [Streptomyces sp. TRM70350]